MNDLTNDKIPTGLLDSDEALKWFQENEFQNIPPYFLTHWKTDKSFFYFKGSLLAFDRTKKYYIIAGEPVSLNQDDDSQTYNAFLEFAHNQNKKVCGYYVDKSWGNESFLKRQLGTSFRIDLDTYDFASSKAKEVRRSLRKGESSNYKIIKSEEIDQDKLRILLKKWKARKLPLKLRFFLSEPKEVNPVSMNEKWFVIEKNGEYFAFCSLLPYVNNSRKGLYVDHLAYDPLTEGFALSYLISSLIYQFKEKGYDELNLGLNPFAKISEQGSVENLFSLLYKMPFMYRPKGLHYFKSKFAGREESEFFFHEKRDSPWFSLIGMMQATVMPKPRRQ